MTREEAADAIFWLIIRSDESEEGCYIVPYEIKALNMAIEALKKESGNNPITNADKIRQMSDDELAEFFAKQEYKKPTFDGWLPLCNHVMGDRICHKNGCKKCWLDWLKEEEER